MVRCATIVALCLFVAFALTLEVSAGSILLRETIIDTDIEPSLLKIASFFESNEQCLLLVHFDKDRLPPQHELEQRFALVGASLVFYIPDHTWLISAVASPSLLAFLRSEPLIRWASQLQPEHKHPSFPVMFPERLSSVDVDVTVFQTPAEKIELRFLLVPGLTRSHVQNTLVDEFTRIANTPSCTLTGSSQTFVSAICTNADSAQALIHALRGSPSILWIERKHRRVLFNAFAQGVTQSGVAGDESIWKTGLTGANQIVALGDSGLDWYRCFFASPDGEVFDTFTTDPVTITPNNGTQLFGYWEYIDRYDDFSGHGTHVAASIAGNADGNPGADVLSPYNGMAPDARLLLTDIGCQTLGGCPCNPNSCPARCTGGVCQDSPRETYEPDDLNADFFPFSYMNGARIHSNSWGEDPNDGSYGTSSYSIDQFAYDHPDMLILFAASNSGSDGLYSLSPEASSKNALAVGAAQTTNEGFLASVNYTNFTSSILDIQQNLCKLNFSDCLDFTSTADCCSSPAACEFLNLTNPSCFATTCCPTAIAAIFTNNSRYSQDNMASFSSRGWTQDGRIKPDIVAPGQRIISSNSQGTINEIACGDIPAGDELIQKSGTSMATPVTAGNAALVRQWYEENVRGKQLAPTASLIKATLINSGVGLEGLLDLNARGDKYLPLASLPNNYASVTPSPYQGFGRIQLSQTLQAPFFYATNGQVSQQAISKNKPAHLICLRNGGDLKNDWLKVTLVWTDPPPFPGSAKALVNDLDLTVIRNFDQYFGNQRFNAKGVAIPDDVNNVEQIYLPLHQNGYFSVTIEPTTLVTSNQTFSVVITGSEGLSLQSDDTNCLYSPLVRDNNEFFTVGNTIGVSVGVSLIFFFFVVLMLLFLLRSRNLFYMSTLNDLTASAPYQSI